MKFFSIEKQNGLVKLSQNGIQQIKAHADGKKGQHKETLAKRLFNKLFSTKYVKNYDPADRVFTREVSQSTTYDDDYYFGQINEVFRTA